jgi:hypothetical protein
VSGNWATGLIACLRNEQIQIITPERIGFCNETQALGVTKAWSAWHHADISLSRRGDAVLLMTDGNFRRHSARNAARIFPHGLPGTPSSITAKGTQMANPRADELGHPRAFR